MAKQSAESPLCQRTPQINSLLRISAQNPQKAGRASEHDQNCFHLQSIFPRSRDPARATPRHINGRTTWSKQSMQAPDCMMTRSLRQLNIDGILPKQTWKLHSHFCTFSTRLRDLLRRSSPHRPPWTRLMHLRAASCILRRALQHRLRARPFKRAHPRRSFLRLQLSLMPQIRRQTAGREWKAHKQRAEANPVDGGRPRRAGRHKMQDDQKKKTRPAFHAKRRNNCIPHKA
jgi:hypothetical protein